MAAALQQRARRAGAAAVALALAAGWGPVRADDLADGQTKARACAVCHGPLGVAVAPDTPNLAGQPAAYLVQQLRAYRSGARKHEVMSVMAKPLTDADIDLLSAWFAAIRVDAAPPR